MDAKTKQLVSKLLLEDDEDDIVMFTFPNQRKKIKCSISMLAEISPVFEAMFSNRWCQGTVKDDDDSKVERISQEKTIQLSDDVSFDQYVAFMLLMQILYGLQEVESLTVDQATDVYYYSNNYQLKDVSDNIQKFLNGRMESGMSTLPLTVNELTESIGFAQLYHLDEFKKKLDGVKLAFDEDNSTQFWDLAIKFEMKMLQQQVLDHTKTIAPKDTWPMDLLLAVIGILQACREGVKKELEGLRICSSCCKQEYLQFTCYCSYCRSTSYPDISLLVQKL